MVVVMVVVMVVAAVVVLVVVVVVVVEVVALFVGRILPTIFSMKFFLGGGVGESGAGGTSTSESGETLGVLAEVVSVVEEGMAWSADVSRAPASVSDLASWSLSSALFSCSPSSSLSSSSCSSSGAPSCPLVSCASSSCRGVEVSASSGMWSSLSVAKPI